MAIACRKMLFVLTCSVIFSQIFVGADIIIDELERTIDLTSQLAKISTVITLENKGNSAVNEFLLGFQANEVKHLAFLEISVSMPHVFLFFTLYCLGLGLQVCLQNFNIRK